MILLIKDKRFHSTSIADRQFKLLFKLLSMSCAGCQIGRKFMGAFGYADDIILLAPTKRSLYCLLDICTEYSRIST